MYSNDVIYVCTMIYLSRHPYHNIQQIWIHIHILVNYMCSMKRYMLYTYMMIPIKPSSASSSLKGYNYLNAGLSHQKPLEFLFISQYDMEFLFILHKSKVLSLHVRATKAMGYSMHNVTKTSPTTTNWLFLLLPGLIFHYQTIGFFLLQ